MLVFAAVVRAGSFSRAATELRLSKQGVSERVLRLERALGVRLLERTTRRLRPTDAGSVYVERSEAIAAQIVEANDLARERQSEPVGVLRVASPTLFGRRFLTPAVSRYVAENPRVHVDITLTNRPVDLIGDGFDLAIQIGRLRDSNFTARRLGDAVLYFVASPEYLATHGTPSPGALGDARCLGFRPVEEWRIDEYRLRVTPVVTINDVEALCEMAIAGIGLSQLPGFVCDAALRDGRLVRLFPQARVAVRQISVLYPSRVFLTTRVKRFLDVLESERRPMSVV